MNRKELRQYLQTNMGEYLAEKGFKIDSNNFLFKTTKDFRFRVLMDINTYHVLVIRALIPEIQNQLIETPLNKIFCFDKPDNVYKDHLKNSSTVRGDFLKERIEKSMNFEIDSVYDVERLAEIIKEYLEKTAIPFFEKYSDLKNINQEILDNDMPYEKGIGYTGGMKDFYNVPIAGNGDNKMVERRMFIMRLCNDERYIDFINWYQSHLDIYEANTHESLRLKLYKIFNDTKEYLSKLEIS